MTKLQIDVFAGFNEVDAAEIKVLHEVGATRVIIGLDNQDDDTRGVDPTDYDDDWHIRPQLQDGRLEASYERLLNDGFEVGAHWWVRPVETWETQARAFILSLADRYHGAEPFTAVGDVELFALHLAATRGGFASFEDFVAWWGRGWLRPPTTEDDLRWPRLAAAVYASPNPRSRLLVRSTAVSEVIPMAYGNVKQFGAELPSRGLLPRTIAAWSAELRDDQALTVGMGAYDQARGDLDDQRVMIASAQALVARGIKRAAYWQLESFDGNNWNHASRRAAIKVAGQMEVA